MSVGTRLEAERVRTLRWHAKGTSLATVIEELRRLESELRELDAAEDVQPHTRNSVLNLVVLMQDLHRAEACDRLVAELSVSHPMRAILLHLNGPAGPVAVDAEVTVEAHRLVTGFPVQREQAKLHIRGPLAEHVANIVEPLLLPDIPTFLWWSGKERLEQVELREAIEFSDAVVLDSMQMEDPVDALVELAALVGQADNRVGVADLCWERQRPWCDAIAQFFMPATRRSMLAGLREVSGEGAGGGPGSRIGPALMAGWAAASLGWRFDEVTSRDEQTTEAVAKTSDGREVALTLRSISSQQSNRGELLNVRMAGSTTDGPFDLAIERSHGGDRHASLTAHLGQEVIRQRLALPHMGDPDLLLNVLWASRRDPVFEGALLGVVPLLESLR